MSKRTKYNIFGTEQGVFQPQALNKDGGLKYIGKHTPMFRSSYEKQCFYILERNPNVLWWKSESTAIPYHNGLDSARHNYFVDLTFGAYDKEGKIQTYLVEIKPESQAVPPVKTPRKQKKTLEMEVKRWIINRSKWNAAAAYAKMHGYKFYIWTEQRMFEWVPTEN